MKTFCNSLESGNPAYTKELDARLMTSGMTETDNEVALLMVLLVGVLLTFLVFGVLDNVHTAYCLLLTFLGGS